MMVNPKETNSISEVDAQAEAQTVIDDEVLSISAQLIQKNRESYLELSK